MCDGGWKWRGSISRAEMSQRYSPRWVWHESSVISRGPAALPGLVSQLLQLSGGFQKIVQTMTHSCVTVIEKEVGGSVTWISWRISEESVSTQADFMLSECEDSPLGCLCTGAQSWASRGFL